ncbi:TonB-dependent receptor family protein [Mucilaginibacter sp. HMF5004]|uniref:outer membrane beta-barrel family protein n=1 Tax=Mucilaginibacter rivuli TaxID=2857527 RepID=UPI001C5D311B|nr:outer membrane beta-barrel family protein [Mucilaginibacter rivuli]MBW4888500.1 TonB-dependent receptor family protein [Mucilaginibacter rivuli]
MYQLTKCPANHFKKITVTAQYFSKKTGLALLLLFITSCLYAQSGSVTGVAIDQLSGTPIEFAAVTLYRTTDSSQVTGSLTKANGSFEFTKLKTGNYYLKVHFVGYATKLVNNLNLTNNQVVNIGQIKLSPDQRYLNEVRVNEQKAGVINRIDKQVYSAGQFQAAKGGNAIDVIRNMPSITVNSQGEISMRGSSGFLVLINGKPVQADAGTVLSQLPANAIENIELITSPSAKYDADGKGGIINITTKKGANNGISIAANGQYGLPSTQTYNNKTEPNRYGADATLNYKTNQWDITVGGNYLRNDIAGQRDGDVNTTVANRYTSFPSSGERSFKRSTYAARATVTYAPGNDDAITAGFYHGSRTQYRIANLVYNNTKTDINTGQQIGKITYYNSNLVQRKGNFTLANLDYNHKFNNKSALALSGLFEYDELDGFTHNRNLNYPDTNTLQQYTANTNTNPLHGYRLQADYSVNIGPGKLETGYQFKYQKQNGTFLTQQQNLASGPLAQLSYNVTDVLNTVQGLYAQYSAVRGKLQYVGGLRYEYSARNFSANQSQGLNNLYLNNLFPSANFLYTFKNGWKTKAGYSRRIQRTNFNELNPYPEREHSETQELGDPDLLPEFVNLYELGVIKTFSKGSAFATLYHQDIKNAINRVNKVLTDTILYRVYTNAGNASLWGAEFGTDLKLTDWWQLYAGANIYNYNIKGNLFGNSVQVNNSSLNYSFNANTGFKITKQSLLQLNINYLSERATAQGRDSRFITPNASYRQTFFKGAMSATLQWQNIDMGLLGTNKQRITTSGSNFYTTTNYIQETDMFVVNLSFNLNQLSKKSKLPNSEFGDKEF